MQSSKKVFIIACIGLRAVAGNFPRWEHLVQYKAPLEQVFESAASATDQSLDVEALSLLQKRMQWVSNSNESELPDSQLATSAVAEADYVIIGAGTAGSLLAERLSRHSSVLVLEQGQDSPKATCFHMPGACCTFERLPVQEQNRCDGNCYRRLFGQHYGYHEIKGLAFRHGLGGTSVIAIGIHFRDNVTSFWRDLAAKHGEHWLLAEERLDELERKMSVRKEPFIDADHLKFAKVAASSMLHNQSSVIFPRYLDTSGYATNTYTQFLKQALQRPNVNLMSGLYVHRLLPQFQAAPLVSVGTNRWIRANKEVIVAGGAIGSAALLQRSGLKTATLRDAVDVRMAWQCPGCTYIRDFIKHVPSLIKGQLHEGDHVLTLPRYDSGVFATLEGSPALIVADTDSTGYYDLPYPAKNKRGVDETVLFIHVFLLQPHHFEGVVTDYGGLDRDMRLTDSRDIAAATAGMQAVRRVMKILAGNLSLGEEVFPGAHVETDAQLNLLMQTDGNIWSFQSGTGSCRVGDVVDGELRVPGVHGLRVADASVLPHPPHGRTLFSTLMTAEIASDLLEKAR